MNASSTDLVGMHSLQKVKGPPPHAVSIFFLLMASSPILAALGGPVYGELVHGHRVHGGHEALHDAEVVVQHLSSSRSVISYFCGVFKKTVTVTVTIRGRRRKRTGRSLLTDEKATKREQIMYQY